MKVNRSFQGLETPRSIRNIDFKDFSEMISPSFSRRHENFPPCTKKARLLLPQQIPHRIQEKFLITSSHEIDSKYRLHFPTGANISKFRNT